MDVSMDCAQIRALLPHRYPFLMVDRIAGLEPGLRCVGEKNITLNEPCFDRVDGDAPRDALRYPLSLQLESFAQVGALLVLASRARPDVDEAYVMLAGSVRNMRVSADVFPGDVLLHHVAIVKEMADTVVIGGSIRVKQPQSDTQTEVAVIDSVVIALRPRAALFDAQRREGAAAELLS